MTAGRRYRFGDFEADTTTGELWNQGHLVRIQDLPFRLLGALLERPGQLVTRAELGQRLWGTDTFVDFEAGLNTAVGKLREALGDEAERPRYVETVPKRGYRFVGRLDTPVVTGGDGSLSVENSRDAVAVMSREFSTGRDPSPVLRSDVRLGKKPVIVLAALAAIGLALVLAVGRTSSPRPVRVAVVLFDNETGDPELDRLAQNLTDSTVARLTVDRRLAVIGNAAVLRTDRPFRDLLKIRDALSADLIILGQIQKRDDGLRVMAHLIRGADQAHVWARPTPFAAGGPSATEAQVVAGIERAVSEEVTKTSGPS
jgi:DNA-binding winged helix-turn-helix (wHTH) protein/TolB-like protein